MGGKLPAGPSGDIHTPPSVFAFIQLDPVHNQLPFISSYNIICILFHTCSTVYLSRLYIVTNQIHVMSSCVHATFQLLFFTLMLYKICLHLLFTKSCLFILMLAISAFVLNSGLEDNMQCLSIITYVFNAYRKKETVLIMKGNKSCE